MNNFGLIGDPIATSLSPALFNAGYEGKYNYDLIEGADFGASFKAFEERYKGINVTAPFKEQAFARADIYTSYCRKIGATNLLVKTPDGILADNSDFTGIILSIAEAYMPGIVRQFSAKYGDSAHIKVHQYVRQALTMLFSRKPQALVVGCGGAGRAAAVAAAELGFDTALMNRTADKAQKIADELRGFQGVRPDHLHAADEAGRDRPADCRGFRGGRQVHVAASGKGDPGSQLQDAGICRSRSGQCPNRWSAVRSWP